MKKEFSNNTTEVFTKIIFHYIPEILKYIDEIKDPRKDWDYSMRYLIFSEMLMFLSEGKSQRFTETAYTDSNYLENIGKMIKEDIKKVPDAEVYTDVFSRISEKDIEDFKYKINYKMIRNKTYENAKVLGKYNCALDGSRFQKAHYEISKEWLSEIKEGKTNWYIAMLELKLVANSMAISLMSSLYPSESLIKMCEELEYEYIFVLKDKKMPTLTKEFLTLVSLPEGERQIKENTKEIILTMWANEIDYKGLKVNVIRQIKKNKQTGENSIWMWITNREVTRRNVEKIIYCAKCRDYIENQGFREQKVTSGIDLEHVYSKNIRAIKMIYTIIQITHLILQIIEHSDICGEFNKKYGSVKVFRRKFYAHITEKLLNIELIQIKIQIRFDKSTLI